MDEELQIAANTARTALRTLKTRFDHEQALIKRRLTYRNYVFSQYYASSFRIMRYANASYQGANSVPHPICNVTWHYRKPGETHFDDGDPIPPEPYRMVVDAACGECGTHSETVRMLNTIDEVMTHLRKLIPQDAGPTDEKRYRGSEIELPYEQFCSEMAASIRAVSALEEIRSVLHSLRIYMP